VRLLVAFAVKLIAKAVGANLKTNQPDLDQKNPKEAQSSPVLSNLTISCQELIAAASMMAFLARARVRLLPAASEAKLIARNPLGARIDE